MGVCQACEFLKDHPDSKSSAAIPFFLNEMVEECVLGRLSQNLSSEDGKDAVYTTMSSRR
jgi:hypothetical protein